MNLDSPLHSYRRPFGRHSLALAAALFAATLLASVVRPLPVPAAAEGFSDSADAGAHQPAVDALAEWGYFEETGCDTDMFCPWDPIERWVMAVWLVRVVGHKPLPTGTSQFDDVEADQWWSPYVERLVKLKVTTGCKTEPLRYCPDRPVTRAQMATFLVLAFDLEEAPSAGFTDTEGDVHQPNIDALAAAGITSGCRADPPSYCPDKPVTRAQMATFLHRAIATSDRAILAALYHATEGPEWDSRGLWLSDTPVSRWFGVETGVAGRVTRLKLRDNGLSGPIPPELGDLDLLKNLDLSRNRLSGPIPPELGNSKGLIELDLDRNRLTGSIPVELTRITSLRSLNLSANILTGPIPEELGQLRHLQYLLLERNVLEGPIPPQLGQLNLITLMLSSNLLEGEIPQQLSNLAELDTFRVSDNLLEGELPTWLAELPKLRSVGLARNRFTGCIPEGLRDSSNDFDEMRLPFC